MKAHRCETTSPDELAGELTALAKEEIILIKDYNNDVVGLIRAGSGPGCQGPQTCTNVLCVSLQESIHMCTCMCWRADRRTHPCARTHTRSCCRACLANELPNSAPAMLMKVSASMRYKYDTPTPLA